MEFLKKYHIKKWHLLLILLSGLLLFYVISTVPFGHYVYIDPLTAPDMDYAHDVPLDPESPWPKFRANALQNGRSRVDPKADPSQRPWVFKTGKGIFSSPVIDAEGTAYIGSADHYFYAIKKDGSLKWRIITGEVIDSSALLDDRGRVYFGSGDANLYCLDRATGNIIWKTRAHTVEEAEKTFGFESYNLDWFEGNVAMLKDGDIIAPNDNFLVYRIDRDTGQRKTQFVGNELMWSLPAVNVRTGRIFFGSQYMALRNIFCFDPDAGTQEWAAGGLGSNAASPLLTSHAKKGVVVLGGYDGIVRAYAQDSGKELWKRGTRDHIYSSPAQLSDGSIIQPSADGTIYALNPSDGSVKWAFDTLEPIRSSPAVDSRDRIYVGSGEGRLFCLNPNGTLRWAYLCIDEDRNDLNASPGLGKTGVYIAGENGGVFFVPYDYPLTAAGKKDRRCTMGPDEVLPPEGRFLVYTSSFGSLLYNNQPGTIDANQPLAFTLFIRERGDTVKSAIDRDSLEVSVTGSPKMLIKVSANRQFFVMIPEEAWMGPDGGNMTVAIKGSYTVDLRRFGLKFFGGGEGGTFEKKYTFSIAPRKEGSFPYHVPATQGDPSTVFAMSRFSAPNPTMLPSWNQIGFDSLHYLCGIVEGEGDRALAWVVGGKLREGKTVVDPALEARFPLMLHYDRGQLTLINSDGFKVNFIGSWDMPFGFYRIATSVDPMSGEVLHSPSLTAVALCDEIEYYGKFLKLMGMSEFDTGHMAVFGGCNMALWGRGYVAAPGGIGRVRFSITETSATAEITGGSMKKDDHVYSLLLVNAETGRSFPLYYTGRTRVVAGPDGVVRRVTVKYRKGEVKGNVRIYFMSDTYPAARATIRVPSQ